MMLSFWASLGFIFVADSAELIGTRNIAFDGPFNSRIDSTPRRLIANGSYPTDGIKFYHGVASGEPSDTNLLIWTRVTPPFQDEYAMDRTSTYNATQLADLKATYHTLSVDWAISTAAESIDFDCDIGTMCGSTLTAVDVDYTVKVIVDELVPDSWYFYQFKVGNITSDIGRTRTIPSNETEITSYRFAFSSCKQYAHGFFNNLGDIASRDDLDMMVWLGDYIYEFPNDPLVNGSGIDRVPFPDVYLYNLSHYRGRYLLHHLDEDVKAAHQALPWYIVWDDHEVVNDYWKAGASSRWQDDSLFGVTFDERRANGYQAFFEWTPTRTLDVDARGGLYRSYRIGNLFDLILIDARSQRTEPAANLTVAGSLSVDEHYAMGQTQREWFLSKLTESQSSGVRWRILGSDDVFGQSPAADVFDGEIFFGEDKLEGYPAERQLIIDWIIDRNITNVVSLAGGPHTGIAHKVYSTGEPLQNDTLSFPVITEFVLDALSAPKLFEEDDLVPYITAYEEKWSWVSPYFRLMVDGYGVMELSAERVKVEYWINNDTTDQHSESVLDVELCVYDGIVDFADCATTDDGSSPDKMLSSGAIIGISLAVAFVVGLFALVLCFCAKNNFAKKEPIQATPIGPSAETGLVGAAATNQTQITQL